MTWTIDKALSDDLVRVVERDDKKGVYILRFGSLKTAVKIHLRRSIGNQIAFTQSHAIQTTLQPGPYWTSRPMDKTAGDALHKAISGITMFYRKAVEQGHDPDEDWLVLR